MRKSLASFVLAVILLTPSNPSLAMPDIDPAASSQVASLAPDLTSTAKGVVASKTTQKKHRPTKPTLVAKIDLSRQRMTVIGHGRQLYHWRISSGRSGYETPPGKFKPGWMARQWYSRKYDMAPMPYSVFFNQGIATHGTTAVSRLGRPASHGCIRLQTSNARRFYNLVRRHGMSNTRIVVHGRTRKLRRRVAKSRARSRRVRTARSYRRTPRYDPRARPRARVRRPARFVYTVERN